MLPQGNTDSNFRRHLSTDAKEVINNVYSTLVERDNMSKQKALDETALLTKVPVSSVWKIVHKPIEERKKERTSALWLN